MKILSTRTLDEQGPRMYAARDVLVDPDGHPVAVRHYPSAGERAHATIAVALRQRRIRQEQVPHFLDLAASDPDGCCDQLVALPPQPLTEKELYAAFADLTGVLRPRRPEVVAGDEAYATYAAATGVPYRRPT